jgi:hypothetical protein
MANCISFTRKLRRHSTFVHTTLSISYTTLNQAIQEIIVREPPEEFFTLWYNDSFLPMKAHHSADTYLCRKGCR